MPQQFEVIVIGGGITGAAIARDCAMRGFSTLLLEKRDFGAGTTGACMGLIHGGLQYVVSEYELTELSCLESGIIQRLAPHLVFRVPFLYVSLKDPSSVEKYLLVFQAYDQLGKHKNSKSHVVLTGEEARAVEPSLSPKVQVAVSTDEPGIDVFRLVVANLTSAAEHGAIIRNHVQVTDILRDGQLVYGVRVRDCLTGETEDYRSDYVVNAAGPWTPQVAALAEVPFRLRPIKGIHMVFDRHVTSVGVAHGDAILLPHENGAICGIANEFYFQNPDEVRAYPNQVEELLSAMEPAIPTIRQARITRAFAGVRPTLPDDSSKDQRAVSRNYQIFDHEELDDVKGFITIAGGKMVIARRMAESLTDLLCQKTGRDVPCRTAIDPLPGGEGEVDPAVLASDYGVSLYTATRLVQRHGARASEVLEESREKEHRKSHVCTCEPVTEAEIRYSIRHEWARTLDDLRRRTRLGMGPCQGTHCTSVAAGVLADELSLSVGRIHADILDFLQSRWRGRYPTLHGTQLRQEELLRACYVGVGGYDDPELERVSRWRG